MYADPKQVAMADTSTGRFTPNDDNTTAMGTPEIQLKLNNLGYSLEKTTCLAEELRTRFSPVLSRLPAVEQCSPPDASSTTALGDDLDGVQSRINTITRIMGDMLDRCQL